MSKTMIVSEKPAQAEKIATALADSKIKVKLDNKVKYYEITHKGKNIVVVCAVGHLFNLAEKEKNGWNYPVFNLIWKPIYIISKSAAFSKNYIETIKNQSKECNEFYVGTDKDDEGELIGANVLRFIINKKDGKRMEFSTLTKEDLIKAFENAKPHLDFPLIEAGETRHYLDWVWGINLSRALTLAVKSTGSFKLLSSGRVQGPALKIIVDREKEIQKFKSVPYWQLELITEKLTAFHKKDKFWEKDEVEKIYKNIKDEKSALITQIKKNEFLQYPPNPFDLTALQLESYRCFGISPKDTLAIAQDLYINGLISYPRTSSNQLPVTINYKKILTSLVKYNELAKVLLQGNLKPNNGKKKDPAHPAIYPSGVPSKLSGNYLKIYDLIVKRFFATFSQPAKRETVTIESDVKKEIFIAQGTRTIEQGWHKFYQPYIKLKEEEFPNVKQNDKLKIKKINLLEKETQPPKRYNPASIINELSKKNLGTKSTRAAIIDALYQRYYVKDTPIQATDLGIKIVSTLEKYCPQILDEELTRHFELDLEKIREKKKEGKKILKEAQVILIKILKEFKENELKIGKSLLEATRLTQEKASILGNCPNCKDGKLRILYSKKSKKYFIACNAYPKCKTTYSLPFGKIQATEKICEFCKTPIIKVIRKGKRPFEMCLTYSCSSKSSWNDNTKTKK